MRLTTAGRAIWMPLVMFVVLAAQAFPGHQARAEGGRNKGAVEKQGPRQFNVTVEKFDPTTGKLTFVFDHDTDLGTGLIVDAGLRAEMNISKTRYKGDELKKGAKIRITNVQRKGDWEPVAIEIRK